MKKLLLIVTILLSFISCQKEEKPEDILSEEKYEQVFIELTIVDQMNEDLLDEMTRQGLRNEVFQEYEITEEDFNRSHRYYEQQVDDQIRRMEEVNLKLREVRDTLAALERSYKEARESGRLDSLLQAVQESP